MIAEIFGAKVSDEKKDDDDERIYPNTEQPVPALGADADGKAAQATKSESEDLIEKTVNELVNAAFDDDGQNGVPQMAVVQTNWPEAQPDENYATPEQVEAMEMKNHVQKLTVAEDAIKHREKQVERLTEEIAVLQRTVARHRAWLEEPTEGETIEAQIIQSQKEEAPKKVSKPKRQPARKVPRKTEAEVSRKGGGFAAVPPGG